MVPLVILFRGLRRLAGMNDDTPAPTPPPAPEPVHEPYPEVTLIDARRAAEPEPIPHEPRTDPPFLVTRARFNRLFLAPGEKWPTLPGEKVPPDRRHTVRT